MVSENASVDSDTLKLNDNDLLVQWNKTQGILQTYKLKEQELRLEIVRRKFETAPIGTTNFDLPKGFKLKCVKKQTYRVDTAEVETALDEIRKLGNEGVFIANRLIKWKPELSLTEYKQIPEKVKAIIDKVLTISDAMPTLEIVEPKRK